MFNFEKKINDLIKNNIFEYKDGVMVEDYNRLDCMYIALDELTELFHKTNDRFTKDTIMHAILILITKISKLKVKIRKEDEQLNEYTRSELISMMDDIFSKQRWEQHDTTIDNTNKKDDSENNSNNKKDSDNKKDDEPANINTDNSTTIVIDTADNHHCHCLNCSCNEMVVDKSTLNPLNKSNSDNEESVNTDTDDYTTTIILDLKCNKNAEEISHLLKKYIESNLIDLLKKDNIK